MFYIDGWRPISELYSAVILTATLKPIETAPNSLGGVPFMEFMPFRRDAIGEVLGDLRQFKVLLANGTSIEGTRALVSDLSGLRTRHIDLTIGTIGSGSIQDDIDDEDPHLQRFRLEKRYGFLLGCPVMVNRNELDEVLRTKYPWHTTDIDITPEQEARVAKAAADLAKPRRGNPGWYGGLPERMVRKRFAPLIARGDYAEKLKKEATRDAFTWLKELTDDEVPMETIEDWLRPLWPAGVGK